MIRDNNTANEGTEGLADQGAVQEPCQGSASLRGLVNVTDAT